MAPPSTTPFQLNTDGSTHLDTGQGGIGSVIRDSTGNWHIGFSGHHISHGSVETELLALYHDLQLTFTHGYKSLEVNLDVQAIITILQTYHPLYANLIHDCRFLLTQLDDPAIFYTYREQN